MADGNTKANKKSVEKREKLRDELWPGHKALTFDPGATYAKGYCQVPRAVPLVARLVNELGGPENAGALYQVLWAQDWGQGLVEVRNFRSLLFEAGYSGKGSRLERTWGERIRILESLGFIRTAANGLDPFGFILLLDPHVAVSRLDVGRLAALERNVFDAWMQQYKVSCAQWGVDLSSYLEARLVAEPESKRDGA